MATDVSSADSLPAPRYRHPPRKVGGVSMRRISASLLENLFFAAATGLSFAVGVVLFIQGVRHPINLLWFIVFWALIAYLALPRLHRILTAIYLPDYFIGRARTSSGLLGDPVNIALRGSAGQLHAAMTAAGWVRADPINLRSAWRIFTSSLFRLSYPQAPVSPLMLFGHQQAFAYQQQVEGNPSQRHHVRFWPAPRGWLLPGGHQVDWMAAGTYDRRVGLSLFTLEITHKIDRNTDIERDYIIETLTHTTGGVEVELIKDFSTGYHCRNGGGDAIETDGDLPIVDLSGSAAGSDDELDKQTPTEPRGAGARPLGVAVGSLLVVLSFLVTLAYTGLVLRLELTENELPLWLFVTLLVVPSLITTALVYPTWRGSQVARLLLVTVLTAGAVVQVARWLGGEVPTARTLLVTGADLVALYSFTSQTVREWTQRRSPATTLGVGTVTIEGQHGE